MRLSFLLKVFVLCAVLVSVVGVIAVTSGGQFSPAHFKTVQRQTFFEQFVISGGPIVWFVLLPMSFVMVYLAAESAITIRSRKLLPEVSTKQLTSKAADRNDMVSTAFTKASANGSSDYNLMREAAAGSLQQQGSELMRKIDWLNLIGNVSPMVGLFGTVFGMIKLFDAIVTAGGQPQPAQLAEGISVALVTTFWGLLIAIPALAIHGILTNRIETIVSQAALQIEEILNLAAQNSTRRREFESEKQKIPIQQLAAKPKTRVSESALLRE